MPITEFLQRNARKYPDEVALVEVNPELAESMGHHENWKEFDLVEPGGDSPYRKTMTWRMFNDEANRFANLLLSRGLARGEKVGILLMNCIEWLPLYFGALKAGAIVVPLNFRYTADEIRYCLDLADVSILCFGPEFVARMEAILARSSGLLRSE